MTKEDEKTKEAQPAAKAKAERLYEVIDSSCTNAHPLRVHDTMIDGKVKQVKFQYGEKTWMTFAEAMKFQKDGFEIRDEDGIVIQRAPDTNTDDLMKLGADKVIANLNELTNEALYARCVALPEGEKFKPTSAKKLMTAFLADAAKNKIKGSEPKESDALSEDDLDKMGLAAE